jgi:hypothetical protein
MDSSQTSDQGDSWDLPQANLDPVGLPNTTSNNSSAILSDIEPSMIGSLDDGLHSEPSTETNDKITFNNKPTEIAVPAPATPPPTLEPEIVAEPPKEDRWASLMNKKPATPVIEAPVIMSKSSEQTASLTALEEKIRSNIANVDAEIEALNHKKVKYANALKKVQDVLAQQSSIASEIESMLAE